MPVNGKLQKAEITALENSYLSFEGALEGYLLWNADEVLQTRAGGQGLRIYDRLFDDPHVQAVLNKLADAVISRDWIVAPGGDKRTDKRAAELVQTQLQNLNLYDLSETEENHTSVNGFDQVTRSLIISGRLNGYVCAEVMWSLRDGLTVANDIRIRDPRQFGFMRGTNGYVLRHLTRENPFIGEAVPVRKLLTWSYGALDGSPYGRALGRSLFWPVFFKKNIIKFDLKFLERFASPKPTGKYPQGASQVQIDTLKKALAAIANETEIAIPEGMMIEYLEAASSGTVDAYERSLRYWDEQISECVLGETGTTNQSGGGGSRARDQVGNEVRLETSKAIADSLSCTFNRLARWIAAYNFPDAAPPTIYRDFGTAEDLNTRSTRDKTLFDLGYRLNAETVASVYGEGYVEAVAPDKPALIATLGVQGVSALTAILAQAESGQLPKENAIAVLVTVFGIEKKDAAAMVPEPPEQPAQQGGGLADLFGGQDQGQQDTAFAEAIEAALNGTLDFAAKKASGKKPNCNPAKSHFCQTENGTGSCVPLSKKCKYKPEGVVKEAADYTEDKSKDAKTESAKTDKTTIDSQQIPKNISKIEDLRDYVAQWQKDRGFDDPNAELKLDTGIQIHDINHPLTYLASGRTPAEIEAEFGEPGKKYNGSPGLAEELYVAIAESSFLKGSSKDITIDHVMGSLLNPYSLKGDGPIAKYLSDEERTFFLDSDARKKDLERMYDELQGAKSEHKELLQKNNKRIYIKRGKGNDGFIDLISDKTVNKKYGKDPFVNFVETSLGQRASQLVRAKIAENNLSGDRQSYEEIVAEVLASLQQAEFAEIDPDPTDQIIDKTRPLIQDAVAPWLTTIQNFVDQASSLEEIRDGLIHLYPELDDTAFAEAMGQAMLLADLAGREEVLGDDADVAFAEAIEAALNGTLDFAAKKTSGKQPNCNPAKSHFCQTPTGKGSCVPLSKKCKYTPTGVQQTAATYTAPKATAAKKKNSKAAPAPAAPAPAAILPTNQTALDNTRANLVKRFGQKTVEQAEANTKKVLDDADLFIRVGNVATLETILESEFKNSFQLGQDTHDIPHLQDTSYLTARARVEEKTLGIAANTPDNERPIYGYLGSQDLNGASHAGPEKAYGAIAVKLKPQAKDRATFTGADSFKSGFASQAKTDGDPPPPNAASLIAATRHGYDRDKLPRHYPSYYADDSNDGSFLKAAARANSVDDLAPRLAPTGNAYIEAQIHGGLKPSDIAELHFGIGGVTTRPNSAIAKFAKANNIDVYFNDKKLDAQDLDDLITRGGSDPRSQRVRDMQTALNAGDFNTSRQLTQSFLQDSDKIKQKMQPGERDPHLKLLYAETGFDELPKVGTDTDVTQAWQDGGHLMARGVSRDGKDGLNNLRSFQTGDYFVGNGMYGNGTYVGHAGTISVGRVAGYNATTAKKDALRAVTDVAKHGYISKSNVTLRMVLDKKATVVTQTDLSVQRQTVAKAMEASYKKERRKLIPRGAQKFTTADEVDYKNELTNFQSNFKNSKITTTVKGKTDINGNITEEQVWEAIGSDGTKIQRTVKVYTPGPIFVAQGATTFAWVDGPNGLKYYFHISPQGKPTAHAMIELASFEAGPAVLAEKGWAAEPKKGQYNLSSSDAAKITAIDKDYKDIVKVMGLDSDDDESIGRFAVLQGVDAIALDLSYEPKTFMNLLNRSKVTIQKDPIDWATAKKTGAF